MSLHPLVLLLQLAHLLQEAPQPGVQSPHGVSGVLQQVHGCLRKHIPTFSSCAAALAPPSRPEGSEKLPDVHKSGDMNKQRSPQTFHRPVGFTRSQRRILDKHLPTDAREKHEAVRQEGRMYLPCRAELVHPSLQLIHIPVKKRKVLVNTFPLSVFHSASATSSFKTVIRQPAIICFLQSGGPGVGFLPHTHLPPDSVGVGRAVG